MRITSAYLDAWRLREGEAKNNAGVRGSKAEGAFFSLFKEFHKIKPNVDGAYGPRTIWKLYIDVPNGTADEWLTYRRGEGMDEEEAESERAAWLERYKGPVHWFCMEAIDEGGYKAVFLNNKRILERNPRGGEPQFPFGEDFDRRTAELIFFLKGKAKEIVHELDLGTYNAFTSEALPYYQRHGIVKRADFYEACPQMKENILDGMPADEVAKFASYVWDGKIRSLMPEMTAGGFFHACAICYEAAGKEPLPTERESYLRYADGRDDGLSGIDPDSPEAWENWTAHPDYCGGHPWEVFMGGTFTRITMCPMRYDGGRDWEYHGRYLDESLKGESGYYFLISCDAWNRAAEAAKSYDALRDAGYPVAYEDGELVAARFLGEDWLGLAPEGVMPWYCRGGEPWDREILDFVNLEEEEYSVLKDKIQWMPIKKAELA